MNMLTIQQLFKVAANQAESQLRDLPLAKIMNRLTVPEEQHIRAVMVEAFCCLIRTALNAGLDPKRRGPALGDPDFVAHATQLRTMRNVNALYSDQLPRGDANDDEVNQ
jgi:hypothetical protein